MSRRVSLVSIGGVLCVHGVSTAEPAGFQPLRPPVYAVTCRITGVSADGAVVVGSARGAQVDDDSWMVATLWRTSNICALPGCPEDLGFFDAADALSEVAAANADGSVVVGRAGPAPMRWISPGPKVLLDESQVRAVDISTAGTVLLTPTSRQVGLTGPFEPLGTLPGYTAVSAAALSGDGEAVAATCSHTVLGPGGTPVEFTQAARWTSAAGQFQGLGWLPGGERSWALGMSADGTVVVGESELAESGGGVSRHAFRVAAGGAMQDLGTLSGTPGSSSRALDASADGSVIVGESDGRAFVWDPVRGMRDLKAVIEANGHDVSAWSLTAATGVSDDGTVVVGEGIEPGSGRVWGWSANIAEPCTAAAGPRPGVRVEVSTVAASLQPAPELQDTSYSGAFSDVVVAEDGRLAFINWLFGAPGSAIERPFALFEGAPGSLRPVAVQGVFAPELGREHGIPAEVSLRAGSMITFADLFNFGEELLEISILAGPASAPIAVAKNGAPTPGCEPDTFFDTFSGVSRPFMNESGATAFEAPVVGGFLSRARFSGSGANYQCDGSDAFPFVPDLPIFQPGPELRGFGDSGHTLRVGPVAFDAENQIVKSGIAIGRLGVEPETLVAADDEHAPGEPTDVVFTELDGSMPQMNARGHLAFKALLRRGDELVGTAIYLRDGAGLRRIVRTGDPVPGRTDGATFHSFRDFILMHDGRIVFRAHLPPPPGVPSIDPIQPAGPGGVWIATPSPVGGAPTVQPLIADGDPVPNERPCVEIRGATPLATTRSGGIVLDAGVFGGSTARQTLFYFDQTVGLVRLIAQGDPIQLAPGSTAIITGLAPDFAGNGSGATSWITDDRTMALVVETGYPDALRHAVVLASISYCPADFDGTNGVQVADIFAFLRAWFANAPSADFDGMNGIQVADIFAFLRAWFAGC